VVKKQEKHAENPGKRKKKVNKINFIHQQGGGLVLIIVKQAQRNAANVWPQVGVWWCGWCGVAGWWVADWQVGGLALKRAFDTRRVCILHAAGERENG